MSLGPWQIIIIVLLVVLLFGRGKISSLMGDVAKGINSFKKGLKEGEDEVSKAAIEVDSADTAKKTEKTEKTGDSEKTGS